MEVVKDLCLDAWMWTPLQVFSIGTASPEKTVKKKLISVLLHTIHEIGKVKRKPHEIMNHNLHEIDKSM